MKKIIIIIGSIGILYFLVAYILPKFVGIPLASYNSYKTWKEDLKENHQNELTETTLDSIGDFPFPIGPVSDYETIFTESQISKLAKTISDYEKETTREIAIVTISTIEPYDTMKDYATDLANEWGIGNPETDNGLLILFSKNLRKIRIATGLGTEKILMDEICKNVIEKTIIPEFKNGDYYSGIEKGLAELITKWK